MFSLSGQSTELPSPATIRVLDPFVRVGSAPLHSWEGVDF